MKELIAGIVLVLVIGVAGFFYRNSLEHRMTPGGVSPVACTLEAKLCPDGTSVGRSGPKCEFTPCAPPNVEDKELGIAFVVPQGYTANPDAIGAEPTLSAVFDKPSKGTVPHSILIRSYPIPTGKSANEVIIANTMFESSGNPAKSMSEFKQKTIQGKTFYGVVVERFEGQIHSLYYLPRATDVLRFEVLEKDVDWTNPKLVVEDLPEHKALLQMLATLQSP